MHLTDPIMLPGNQQLREDSRAGGEEWVAGAAEWVEAEEALVADLFHVQIMAMQTG